jgi:hypothetical protein
MCDCYVRLLKPEFAYGVHWGAHELACPKYRKSLDPVDHENDLDLRAAHLMGKLRPEFYRPCPFYEPGCTNETHRELAVSIALGGVAREGVR